MILRGRISRGVFLSLLLATGTGVSVEAQEGPSLLASDIDSVRLFKNGVVTVRETLTLPGPGSHWLLAPPDPIHGTFGARAAVPLRVTMTELEVPAGAAGRAYPSLDGRALTGKTVLVRFIEEHLPPVTGVVRAVPSPWERRDVDPTGTPPGWTEVDSYGTRLRRGVSPVRSELVLVSGGSEYVIPTARIGCLEVLDGPDGTTERRAALRLEAEGPPGKPIEVTIEYATLGAVWTPSYVIDLSDPPTLTIRQRAEIRNDLIDWVDTEVTLVSGVPSFDFQYLRSLLSPTSDLVGFLDALSRGPPNLPWQQPSSNNVTSQRAHVDAFGSTADAVFIDELGARGSDLILRSIGRRTLSAGDTMHIALAESTVAYERIITWSRLHERSWWGSWHSVADQGLESSLPMESIRFENPFADPLTTAPALIVDPSGPRSQGTLRWAEPGEQLVIPVSRALSVRVNAEEEESGRSNDRSGRGPTVQMTGTLRIENLRAEAITLYAQLEFRGTLESATGDPRSELRAPDRGKNPLHRLSWVIPLESGEKRELTYNYWYYR